MRASQLPRLIIITALIFALQSCSAKLPEALEPGYSVPLTRVTYLDGTYDTLHSYRGQKIAVLFWAKWCSKSRSAMKKFNALASSHSSEATFLAINLDKYQDESDVRQYITLKEFDAPTHAFSGNGPDDEAALAFRAFEIPVVFLVDQHGVVQISSHKVRDLEDGL